MQSRGNTAGNQLGVGLRYKVRAGPVDAHKIAWSPNGHALTLLQRDGSVLLLEAATGRTLRTIDAAGSDKLDLTWSPDGNVLATASDEVIQLWGGRDGKLLRSFETPLRGIVCVGWCPRGRLLASAHRDGVIRIWDAEQCTLLDLLKEHTGIVTGLKWSPDGMTLVSCSADKTVRLWESATWRLLETLPVESEQTHFAWSPDSRVLAFSSGVESIRLWNLRAGREMGIIEGHTDQVTGLSFSPKGSLLASVSRDGSLRLWDCGKWVLTRSFSFQQGGTAPTDGLVFHPTEHLLAALGQGGREVYVWDVDSGAAVQLPSDEQSVRYVTAKGILVGDTGAGKTSLAKRLARDDSKASPSTRAQQLFLIDDLGGKHTGGASREVVLFDSAGAATYQRGGAPSLDVTDLMLLVFDATLTEPLKSVEHALSRLPAGRGRAPRKILVGTKADAAPSAGTTAELELFCRMNNIEGGYVFVSAHTGRGLDELRARIEATIEWDKLPDTLTTTALKTVKRFVLSLKGSTAARSVIIGRTTLRRLLKAAVPGLTLRADEMMAAVGQLAAQNYVSFLPSPAGGESILLAPEVLTELATSLTRLARNHPSGLGAIYEDEIQREADYLPELAGLRKKERELLLDAAAALLLRRGVCFRGVLGQKTLLIFPSLIRREKPPGEEPRIEDGCSYIVRGEVETVYASLVVLLGYNNIFMRASHWRNRAEYEVRPGEVCGFRQIGRGNGELELILYYGVGVPESRRNMFQGLFEMHLVRDGLSVERYAPAVCPNVECDHLQERAVVLRRRLEGREHMCCEECGERLPLPRADVLTPAVPKGVTLKRADVERLESEGERSELRVKFEEALRLVTSLARNRAERPPTCFISYAWGDERHERWVRESFAPDLTKAGIRVVLDENDNARVGSNIARFISRIARCDFIVTVGTPLYASKGEDENMRAVVYAELDLINQRLTTGTEEEKSTVLPILLEGDAQTSLPPLLRGRLRGNFIHREQYFAELMRLIVTIHRLPFNQTVKRLLKDLSAPRRPSRP